MAVRGGGEIYEKNSCFLCTENTWKLVVNTGKTQGI